jgi:ribosome biogenesis GTPase
MKLIGTVVSGSNNCFIIENQNGRQLRCSIKGKILKSKKDEYNPLAVGDMVIYEETTNSEGLITGLVPRKSLFWRYNEKGKAVQNIAANMDLLVCIACASVPPFRPRFIDRVTLQAVSYGIDCLIVINKSDLGISEASIERIDNYQQLGFKTLLTSAHTGYGLDDLKNSLCGRKSAFIGQSGSGKSSIINSLQSGIDLKTGAVNEKYLRGRHTTTSAVMIKLNDGITTIIDTPGFRRFSMQGIDPLSLGSCFPEIEKLQTKCELESRCTHIDEPGCAVLQALEDGLIHLDRYESYSRVFAEINETTSYKRKIGRPIVLQEYDDE